MMTTGFKRRADWVDTGLVLLFLIGIYLKLAISLGQGLPVPMVLSGIAGMALLLRNGHLIQTRVVIALLVLILLYLFSILSAPDYRFLTERFKGFVQLCYSLIICYAFFVTILKYDREWLARIFFGFCITIIIGCTLETYTAFKEVSDAYRSAVFETGLYAADLRDEILYGGIRPKLFTSEPSSLTFHFTFFSFAWLVVSTWRFKHVIYFGLLAAGFFLMRGPTLLLGFLLVIPYELFLASRKPGLGVDYNLARLSITLVLGVLLLVAFYVVGTTLYAERIDQITRGSDPSFFSRVTGPALIAFNVMSQHPIAGAGLTGDEFIANIVIQVFDTSPDIPKEWLVSNISGALVNYFWLHWIYLGLLWGSVILVALVWYLRVLGAPSLLFCGAVWIVFSQASGAYVSPGAWLVLYLSCALAIMHQRERAPSSVPHLRARGPQLRVFRPFASAP